MKGIANVLLRLTPWIACLPLWVFAKGHQVFFGLKYALCMCALWVMIEIAFRLNPAGVNIPGLTDDARSHLYEIDAHEIGRAVSPISIGASLVAVLVGFALTSIEISSKGATKDLTVLIVPAGPLILGIPVYLILGRLTELASGRGKA